MVSTSTGSFAKLDSLEIISGAAFRIIGLTKIPKIEFLPLDWIYRSIRIITVAGEEGHVYYTSIAMSTKGNQEKML